MLSVVGITLAACGSDDSATTAAPSDDTTTSSSSTTTVAAESVPDTTTPEPAPETAPAPVTAPETAPAPEPEPVGADCLIGDWKITDGELNSYYDALTASVDAAGSFSMDTTGEVLLSFTETTYEYVGDFDLTLTVAGQSGTGAASGTVDGAWTAEDGVLQTELGSSNLNIIVTVAGQTFDGSDLGNGFVQSDPLNNAPYSCDGPTIMFQAGVTEDVRHPLVLTPA